MNKFYQNKPMKDGNKGRHLSQHAASLPAVVATTRGLGIISGKTSLVWVDDSFSI